MESQLNASSDNSIITRNNPQVCPPTVNTHLLLNIIIKQTLQKFFHMLYDGLNYKRFINY